ncbi:MAG: DUF1559 domain-containing protein [Pirellulales bacterium]
MKQLGLGFQNHVDSYKIFPTGGGPTWQFAPYYIGGKPVPAPRRFAGWGFQVLPFIEEGAVWRGGNATTDQTRAAYAIGQPIAAMFCPTRTPEVVNFSNTYPYPYSTATTVNGPHAKNDYAASSITTDGNRPEGVGVVICINDWNFTGAASSSDPQPNKRKRGIAVRDVADGTSKTLVLSEKRMNTFALGQLPPSDNEGYACGWNHDIMRNTNRVPVEDYNDTNISETAGDGFGSAHVMGVMAAFADGSTTFIPYEISAEQFRRAGDRNDGLTLNLP